MIFTPLEKGIREACTAKLFIGYSLITTTSVPKKY